ncbi:MAG: UvrB/UvrC motif-containing protein [Phycisphaerales bacterium]|nr:UvrB/UvrC motif-containing protein [Phycisphaerales bacterium]
MRCQHCDKPAVVHEVLIKNGKRTEVHLCETHAAEAGVPVTLHQPINQLLSQLVNVSPAGAKASPAKAQPTCSTCGLTFAQFRNSGILGCPDCYDIFEQNLGPLIEKAHAGAVSHTGKVPQRAGGNLDLQLLRQRLVRELDEAVAAEQYERAARLRDRLLTLPESGCSPATGIGEIEGA